MPNARYRPGLPARASGIAVAFVCAASALARAQAENNGSARFTSEAAPHCSDTLVAANVTRVTVALHALVKDSTQAIRAQADLIVQRIADAARNALGASGQSIPAGDSLGMFVRTFNNLPIVVVIRRDVPSTLRLEVPVKQAAPPKVAAFYTRVLQSIPSDSLWMVWPDGYAPDSIDVHLVLLAYNQGLPPAAASSAFTVFTTNGISVIPAVATYRAPIEYPRDAEFRGIPGGVLLEFAIDTSGRAEANTVHVLRPSPAQIDTSAAANFFREFIQVSRYAAVHSRYMPARIGACPVEAWVVQPFEFRGPRR